MSKLRNINEITIKEVKEFLDQSLLIFREDGLSIMHSPDPKRDFISVDCFLNSAIELLVQEENAETIREYTYETNFIFTSDKIIVRNSNSLYEILSLKARFQFELQYQRFLIAKGFAPHPDYNKWWKVNEF